MLPVCASGVTVRCAGANCAGEFANAHAIDRLIALDQRRIARLQAYTCRRIQGEVS
jgi:hypothetical protein